MQLERQKSGLVRLSESATFVAEINERAHELLDPQLLKGDLPTVIYPEIRAITANKRTRNNTFYPDTSLMGNKKDLSGYRSALAPYPIPFIKDHLLSPNPNTGYSSEVYGRCVASKYVKDGGAEYVLLVPAITHPEAIEGILGGRWLTTSIGVDAESVNCNICGADMLEEPCRHVKGEVYTVGKQEKVAALVIGPIYFQENSFVVQPSDTEAGVLNPNIEPERLRVLMNESHTGRVIDLTTGFALPKRMKESFMPTKQLAVLHSPARKASISLFVPGTSTKENAELTKHLPFTEEVKEAVLARLAREEAIEGVTPASNDNIVEVEINETNYESLFPVIEELHKDAQAQVSKFDEARAELKSTKEELEVKTTELEEKTTKLNDITSQFSEIQKQIEEATISETALNEAVEAKVTELTAQHQEAIANYTTLNEVLNTDLSKTKQSEHRLLAEQVALLQKFAQRKSVKDKTLAELTAKLMERTQDSLRDSLAELLEDTEFKPKVDVTQTEQVESPVLATPLVEDSATGRITFADSLITEEEDTEANVLTRYIKQPFSTKPLRERFEALMETASK